MFEIILHELCKGKVALGGENLKLIYNCNLLPNLLKLVKFRVIVQDDELHKMRDYFL